MAMTRKTLWTAAGLAACLCLAATARADATKKISTDREFVDEAAAGGMAEVRLGKLAQTNASSPEVRKFGELMVEDHSRANKELMALLQKKGMATPGKELPKKMQECYDNLSRLKGAEFDRAYIKDMLKDHKEDVALFESFAKNGQDADIRAFAIKTLPTLREHLQKVQDLADKDKSR
jgi:putative membrane protein